MLQFSRSCRKSGSCYSIMFFCGVEVLLSDRDGVMYSSKIIGFCLVASMQKLENTAW
jgi:hypothetical protein